MLKRLIIIGLFLISASTISVAQSVCDGNQIFSQKDCLGDAVSTVEKALFDLVADYRSSKKLPSSKLSLSLSKLANRHLIDITTNLKAFTHSWSNCLYDIKDEKTWHCIIDSPRRLNSGYLGQGYETLYVTSELKANVKTALDAWKKSTLHNSIITNQGMFKDLPWEEIGVAVNGNYACLWFGTPKKALPFSEQSTGLGITYDQIISGLTSIVPLKQESSTVESTKWKGMSADKTVSMDVYGTKRDISEAKMSITAKLQAGGELSKQNFNVLMTLLKNAFPTWPDRESWFQGSLKEIGMNNSVVKTKVLGKNHVEMKYGAGGAIVLQIMPRSAVRAIEID
ncbi:MAG: hypothetical protein IPG67_16210 [Acidobacteria bacterium]|nr:hypothetical protein [Acidobacteriota bacterium]MBK7935530.1 hypothetical protein [Acidobacteriota bacterium]